MVKTSVTPTRTTTKDSNKCGQRCGESDTLAHGWWECKMVHPLWKTVWQVLRNYASLPYDAVSLLPGMYVLKSIKNTGPRKNLYMNLHISIICNSPKKWKKSKCLSTGEWIHKMWYFHAMEYYSATKRNEALVCANDMDEP